MLIHAKVGCFSRQKFSCEFWSTEQTPSVSAGPVCSQIFKDVNWTVKLANLPHTFAIV